MPFLDRPAERLEELFDREEEFKALRKAAVERAATVVVGARRVGKTSLVKVATDGLPRIYLDARKFEEMRYLTYQDFLKELRQAINHFTRFDKGVFEFLRRVKGVNIGSFGLEFSLSPRERPTFASLLTALDEWGVENGLKVVVVIDEAQELSRMRGYSVLPAIAYAYDNLRHVNFVFAGSKVGLLYRFLKVEDPESPLYGRYLEKVEVNPLPREKALEFLREGFKEYGLSVSEGVLELAVDYLDGVIGWLSYLGLTAVREGRLSEDVVKKVLNEASKVVVSEFCGFVRMMGSERYVFVLNAVARGASWSEIRDFLEVRLGVRVYDSELSRLLKNLVDSGFLMKVGNTYFVADPVLKYVASEVRCF